MPMLVIFQRSQNTDGQNQKGNGCSLGRLLGESKQKDQGRYDDNASPNAHQPAKNTGYQPNQQIVKNQHGFKRQSVLSHAFIVCHKAADVNLTPLS